MTALLVAVVALAWAGVAIYLVREARTVCDRWLTLHYPTVPPSPEDVAVPDDIAALAMSYADEWAQEDVLKAAREKYVGLRGTATDDATRWNLVRKSLGIGTR